MAGGKSSDNQTPYLHLNLGSDAVKNRNWVLLDQRLYDLARGSIANIPAGGDLAGFYPDPTIKDGAIDADALAPNAPTGGIPIVQPDGTFAWTTMPSNVAGGDLSGTYPNPTVLGSAAGVLLLATRGRVTSAPTQVNLAANFPIDTGYQAANSGWILSMDYGVLDQWSVQRRQPNLQTVASLVTLDGASGKLTAQLADGIVHRIMANADCWLSPIPTGADLGKVLTVAAGPALAWTMATGGGGGATGPAGGDLIGSYPNPSLGIIQSSKVQLAGRGAFFSGPGGASVGVNDPTHDPSYVATSASWVANYLDGLGSDEANVSRRAPNAAAGAFTKLLTINADGTIRATTNPTNVLDLATKQYVDGMVGGGGPPVGAAGGSLAGNYPNPILANNVVQTQNLIAGSVTGAVIANGGIIAGKFATDAIRTADILDSQITQGKLAPGIVALPTGAAGGDLTGTYPNPTLAAGLKSLWQVAGATITPIDATKPVKISSTADSNPLVFGTRTGKGRLVAYPTFDESIFSSNVALNAAGTAWTLDDGTKPGWAFVASPGSDTAKVNRFPVGGGPGASLLTLDNAGNLTATGVLVLPSNFDPVVLLGSGLRGGISKTATALTAQINHPWVVDDLTKTSWMWQLETSGDYFALYRRAPNAAAGTVTNPLKVNGADGKTYCTLADASVTHAMLAGGATAGNRQFISNITFSTSTYNSWVLIATLPALVTRGSPVYLTANHGCSFACITASGNVGIFLGWFRNGAQIGLSSSGKCGGAIVVPIAGCSGYDMPPAGTWTYDLRVYIESGLSATVSAYSIWSFLAAQEIG